MSRTAHRFVDSRRPAMRRAAAPLLCVLVLFYLGFHAVSGDRGAVAYLKESRRLASLKAELEQVKAEHEAVDNKVRRLSDKSLDLDLLDERARAVLGLAGKNEVVYFLDEKPAK